MIEIELTGLNNQSMYASSLNQIEYICEEYCLENQFGTISMANQEVIEFLDGKFGNYELDMSFIIDNDGLTIAYQSHRELFRDLKAYDQQRQILTCLADNIDLNTDNKSVILSFHVKPKMAINRKVRSMASSTINAFLKNTFVFLFLVCMFFVSFADNYKVLFIGNSYTDVNNLPSLIQQVSQSAGDDISFTASVPGGCTFQNHLVQSMPYIKQGGWNYVVLQEQSQLPSFPINQFMNECYPYAEQLCDSIRKYNPEAQIVFYMTWGRKNGDQQNAVYYPVLGTYEGMDSLLYARYMMMAEDNNAIVSPVGALWHYIRDNYPNLELYQSDESHPSILGSYAAACSFYTVLFRKSPLQITENCGIDNSVAEVIREAAKTVVFDSLNKWLLINSPDTTENDTLGISVYDDSNIRLYPNPTTDFLNVQTDFSLENCVCTIYDQMGKRIAQYRFNEENSGRVNVSNLVSGVYILKINRGEQVLTTRMFSKR